MGKLSEGQTYTEAATAGIFRRALFKRRVCSTEFNVAVSLDGRCRICVGSSILGGTDVPPNMKVMETEPSYCSIPPAFLPDGQAVEGLLMGTPFRMVLVHE